MISKYVKSINDTIKKVENIIASVKVSSIVILIFAVIFVVCVNLRNIWKFGNVACMSLLSTGMILNLFNWVIKQNIDINNLLLISQSMSDFIKYLIYDVFSKIMVYGIVFCIVGVLGIVISNYLYLKKLKIKN